MDEKEKLISEHLKIKEAYDASCEKIKNLFFPLAEQAIKDGNLTGARELMFECPDVVVSVFIADAIRQAEGRYE